jgi:hypothetical protein
MEAAACPEGAATASRQSSRSTGEDDVGKQITLIQGHPEQTFRYGYALDMGGKTGRVRRLLERRSARIIVTMEMPAAVYRHHFRAHGLKSPESGVLGEPGRRAK